jgi:hypothetical protein
MAFHELIHYADFRFMPRFVREAAWLMGRAREKSA